MNLIVCREVKVCFSEHSACFLFLFFVCWLFLSVVCSHNSCLFLHPLSGLTSVGWSHIRRLLSHLSVGVGGLRFGHAIECFTSVHHE